ncbi:MAG: very short patch repair endonuclease [Candidatus Pacebacteria bacterium]|nr:very short patch repair endonuclease [Candidatus Paceibacterota bacterium]
MIDRLTPTRRSWLMSRIRGKNTTPELRVRKAAHALGLRFRLHRADLPGTPDLVIPSRHVALFVHGCYWHRHPDCPKATAPSSPFWAKKFISNVRRDRRVERELHALGCKVVVIWECETKNPTALRGTIIRRIVRRKVH